MPEQFTKENLNLFLEGAVKLGLSLRECEKALAIKGWPKKFVDKYCKKYYDIHRRKVKKAEKEAKRYAKLHVVDTEIEKIDEELARSKEYTQEWKLKKSKKKKELIKKKAARKKATVDSRYTPRDLDILSSQIDKLEKELEELNKQGGI